MDIFCNVNPVNPSKKIKDEKEQQPLCGVDVPFLNLRGLTLVGIDIISSVTLFYLFFLSATQKRSTCRSYFFCGFTWCLHGHEMRGCNSRFFSFRLILLSLKLNLCICVCLFVHCFSVSSPLPLVYFIIFHEFWTRIDDFSSVCVFALVRLYSTFRQMRHDSLWDNEILTIYETPQSHELQDRFRNTIKQRLKGNDTFDWK